MNRLNFFLLITLVFLLGKINAQEKKDSPRSQVNIWALGDGEKIRKYDYNHPTKDNNNSVWNKNDNTVKLKGFRNEVLAFQIIVEATAKGVIINNIEIEKPKHSASGRIIGSTQHINTYDANGTVELFTQHYINNEGRVTPSYDPKTEKGPGIFLNTAIPKNSVGWIPDALIPVNKVKNKGKNLGDFPVEVVSQSSIGANQGFWVDIYLPRNNDYPAGIYNGSVKVSYTEPDKGYATTTLPLEITLIDQYLPDENATDILVYTSGINQYYSTGTGDNAIRKRIFYPNLDNDNRNDNYHKNVDKGEIEKMIKHEGHRHRIQVIGGFTANLTDFNETIMSNYKKWLDGSGYKENSGYFGPGQGTYDKYFFIHTYDSWKNNNKHKLRDSEESVAHNEANKWVNWFSANAPKMKDYYWYIEDEFDDGANFEKNSGNFTSWNHLKYYSERIKSNTGIGKNLKIFATVHNDHFTTFDPVIDFMAMRPQYIKNSLVENYVRNGKITFYNNGFRPVSGIMLLEGTAIDPRVISWILYKYGAKMNFIWQSTLWDRSTDSGKASVYIDPQTFPREDSSESKPRRNGDGLLFYPGNDLLHPDQDRGITDALVPSIRLKNLRRGQQDAIIFKLVTEKFSNVNVTDNINTGVNLYALWDKYPWWVNNETLSWSENGDDYDKVINNLKDLFITKEQTVSPIISDNIKIEENKKPEACFIAHTGALYTLSNEIKIKCQNKIDNISVYNMAGRLIKSFSPNGSSYDLSLSDLPRAVYVVKVTSGNESVSKKIRKE